MRAQFEVQGRKITIEASMGTLNDIEMMAIYARDENAKTNSPYIARMYDEWFEGIHKALDVKGYYDDVK